MTCNNSNSGNDPGSLGILKWKGEGEFFTLKGDWLSPIKLKLNDLEPAVETVLLSDGIATGRT